MTNLAADPIAALTGWGRPVIQILMRRLESVAGVEAALAPVFDALHTPEAIAAVRGGAQAWESRIGFCRLNGRNGLGVCHVTGRLMGKWHEALGWTLRGPQAQVPDPVDPAVSGDAAWCARALACMMADWGLADAPAGRAEAVEELGGFLAAAAEGLDFERDADVIAAIERARERLEAWRASGE